LDGKPICLSVKKGNRSVNGAFGQPAVSSVNITFFNFYEKSVKLCAKGRVKTATLLNAHEN